MDLEKVIPDDTKSINEQGIVPFGEVRDTYTFKQLRQIAKKYEFSFSTPIKDIPEKVMQDMCLLVKHKSIEGVKKAEVDVVYTMWSNLKKTNEMVAGQVGFHNEKERALRKHVKKNKPEEKWANEFEVYVKKLFSKTHIISYCNQKLNFCLIL